MVVVDWVCHTRKNFCEKCQKFEHASSKNFASPTGLKVHQIISLPGAPNYLPPAPTCLGLALTWTRNCNSNEVSACSVLRWQMWTYHEQRVCYMWRLSANRRNTFPVSLIMVSKNVLLTAVYWIESRRMKLTAQWNSGQRYSACRHANSLRAMIVVR
jgi:hypothetical protein